MAQKQDLVDTRKENNRVDTSVEQKGRQQYSSVDTVVKQCGTIEESKALQSMGNNTEKKSFDTLKYRPKI